MLDPAPALVPPIGLPQVIKHTLQLPYFACAKLHAFPTVRVRPLSVLFRPSVPSVPSSSSVVVRCC